VRSFLPPFAPSLLLLVIFLSEVYTQQTASIAIERVSIIDVVHGRVIPDQTVLVREGRIVEVGSSKKIKAQPGSIIVNGHRRYLSPGFADMHVHLYTEGDLFTYLANGVTTVRNMAGDTSHLELRRRVENGEIFGPRIITAGPIIETKLSHPDNQLVSSADVARQAVIDQKKAGYDVIKIYNDLSPELFDVVMDQAAKSHMRVVGHVPYEVGLEKALRSGQDSIEHLRGYLHPLLAAGQSLERRPDFRSFSLAWNNASTAKMRRLAEETVTAGVWNCPTLVFTVHEMSPLAAHRRLLSRPETAFLSLKGLPKDRTKGYLAGFSEADFTSVQRGLTKQFHLLRALDNAGAGLLVGTDSWLGGFAFADELELLVKAGLSPSRVMRMATMDASAYLGETKLRGSVEKGKIADLVILRGNPLRSISNARKIEGVISGNRYLSRKIIDTKLEKSRVPIRVNN
jgi:imidazolonepropionase-like amidohydrolase